MATGKGKSGAPSGPDLGGLLTHLADVLESGFSKIVQHSVKSPITSGLGAVESKLPAGSGVQRLAGAAKGILSGTESNMGASLGKAFGAASAAALVPLSAGAGIFAAATSQATGQILDFVSKANPASALQFNMALNDLAGTFGQILTPILDSMTGVIKDTSGAFQAMRPALEPIMKGLSEIIAAIGPVAQSVLGGMIPGLKNLGAIITGIVAPTLKTLGSLVETAFALMTPILEAVSFVITDIVIPPIAALVGALEWLARQLKELTFGILGDSKAIGDARGAAVRTPGYGKIEDIGKRTTLSALNVSHNALTPDGKATTEKIDKTNSWLERIFGTLGGIPKDYKSADAEYVEAH